MPSSFRRCFAAAALILAAGCQHGAPPAQPVQSVAVSTAARRTIHPAVTLSGLIAPLQNVAITTDVSEPTDSVLVNEGDSVTKGEVLAQLSTTDLVANLDSAQRDASENAAKLEQARYQAQQALESGGDQVHEAQAALDQARANYSYAEIELSRDEQLLTQGYVSQDTVDQQRAQTVVTQQAVSSAQAALATAMENQHVNGSQAAGLQKADVDAAQAAYASSVAQVRSLQAQIAKATIVSPIDGVVVNRNLNPGEYPGTRQIFTLQEVSHVYAELNAFSEQIANVRPNASVTVISTALPNEPFTGKVVAVLSPATPTSSGFVVKVDVPNPHHALEPGMTVSATVSTPAISGLAIPVSAFIDDTHQTVMVVEDNVAHSAQVQQVASDPRYAVITGLSAGAKVVTNGNLNLSDGQKVAVR
jgi:multidrug efflux pump subunit AcrA (membrane-fusion protein)